jgi:hypothetical protein
MPFVFFNKIIIISKKTPGAWWPGKSGVPRDRDAFARYIISSYTGTF